jgi:hypothetical protein
MVKTYYLAECDEGAFQRLPEPHRPVTGRSSTSSARLLMTALSMKETPEHLWPPLRRGLSLGIEVELSTIEVDPWSRRS